MIVDTVVDVPGVVTSSNAIDAFVAEVRAYCEFVNRAPAMSIANRLDSARERLLKLYLAALTLPQSPEPGDVDAGPDPERPAGWSGFAEKDVYWEVFDPYEQSEPLCGSLSDDLLDVYADVRRGLDLWDSSHREAAVWEWRFHFDVHWGDHVIDALRALHRACKRRDP